jgi:hypothetical protein
MFPVMLWRDVIVFLVCRNNANHLPGWIRSSQVARPQAQDRTLSRACARILDPHLRRDDRVRPGPPGARLPSVTSWLLVCPTPGPALRQERAPTKLHISKKCWRWALASSFGLPQKGLACTMLISADFSSRFLPPNVTVGPVGISVLEEALQSWIVFPAIAVEVEGALS